MYLAYYNNNVFAIV